MTDKKDIEFESDKVKTYVQQIQAENGILRQECERLKNERTLDLVKQLDQLKFDYAELEKRHNDSFEQFKQLKAENDELKEEKQGLIKDWEEKKNLAYEIACKNDKLKQTLIEIKEIVGIGLVDGLQTEEYSGFLKILQAQILQKISECEVNND